MKKLIILAALSLLYSSAAFSQATVPPNLAVIPTFATAIGTDQASALLVKTGTTILSTVASGTGVRLDTTLNVSTLIINRGSNPVLVYPPSGRNIEGFGTNVAVSIAAGGTAMFVAPTTAQIYAY